MSRPKSDDPKRQISISLGEKTLKQLEENLTRFRGKLLQKGCDPKQVDANFTRSSFIRFMIETLANPNGFAIIENSVMLAFDVDNSQTELDLK